MTFQTKEALKSDYKVLMNKIDNQLEEVEGVFKRKKTDLKMTTSEKVKMLEDYRKKLERKYMQMENSADGKFEEVANSVKSTYNDVLDGLSGWLDDLKTKN